MAHLQLAISTGSFYPASTWKALDRIARLGFGQVEVMIQASELNYDFRRRTNSEYFEELKERKQELGLQVTSLHAPPLSGVQAFSSEARSEILLRTMEIAALLRAGEVVVHPYNIFRSYEGACSFFSDHSRRIAEFTLLEFPSILKNAEKHGVGIAIENIAHWYDHSLLNEPNNMLRLVHALDNSSVGVDLDVFHSELGGNTFQFLDKLRDCIMSLHLSDCSDSGNRTIPGRGTTNWEALAGHVRKLPDLEHMVLEVSGQFEDEELTQSASYLRRTLGLEL